MSRRLARFQAGALAIRPTTSWTRPTMGGRVKSAFGGIKRRAKNLLARPGIKSAMNRIGTATGSAVGWARRKTGFSGSRELATFARRRFLSKRKKALLRRMAVPATIVGTVGVLAGSDYLAQRQRKGTNRAINQAQSVLKNARQQAVNDATGAARIKATLQERARGRRR